MAPTWPAQAGAVEEEKVGAWRPVARTREARGEEGGGGRPESSSSRHGPGSPHPDRCLLQKLVLSPHSGGKLTSGAALPSATAMASCGET